MSLLEHSSDGNVSNEVLAQIQDESAPGNKSTYDARAEEVQDLIALCLEHLIPFIARADHERALHQSGSPLGSEGTSLVHPMSSRFDVLQSQLSKCLTTAEVGGGRSGFEHILKDIFTYSVNTSAPGFMDKLYTAPSPPGIAAELILAVLNTNVHVYQVSPVLTLVEKHVTKQLASLFGLVSPRAGGISLSGGSASNLTSIVVARNVLYPETKVHGNFAAGRRLVIFTSADGHYSIGKAAQGLGFGSSAVVSVPTDPVGRMRPDELRKLIVKAKMDGQTPFFINATAGTTVLGSFDPFEEISQIAKEHRCWLHVDGAWGGSFVFSHKEPFRSSLIGIHLADSIALNPHKMLGVPIPCSILLARDLRLFEHAMTLKAGYLFHDIENETGPPMSGAAAVDQPEDDIDLYSLRDTDDSTWTSPNDLADMTMQCGRRGESFKLFVAWQYYGTAGYASMVETAYDNAVYLAQLVDASRHLSLVLGSGSAPSCLQVCFYYTPQGRFTFGLDRDKHAGTDASPLITGHRLTTQTTLASGKQNSRVTARISAALIPRGFMIDFAPALEGQEDKGHFLRAVVNITVSRQTVERLVKEVLAAGERVVGSLEGL